MSEPQAFDPYAVTTRTIREPPKSLWSALLKIGPGIILAGSIVGSGELLLTTSFGAEHGFMFLWLILYSCVIKVFVQIELGRNAISSAKPTLTALDELPGPRIGAHWICWWWLAMLLASVFQLGAMAGGVGQALHLAFPQATPGLIETLGPVLPERVATAFRDQPDMPWAILTALAAILLLLSGTYKRIELITTIMVVGVTFITVVCVGMLPWTGYPVRFSDLAEGFTFDLDKYKGLSSTAIVAAIATFGITGVGASELFAYPYWCIEKGYARFAGPRLDDAEWSKRARGWIRVMFLDAWVSMLVFTFATVAFYILGATVLHRQGLLPEKSKMIATLSEMYVPAFGEWTKVFFLIGAWAVLFKTLYVASASNSRLLADFVGLLGLTNYHDGAARMRLIQRFCVLFPSLALVLYLCFRDPKLMVTIGGFAQGVTLPIISGAAVYMRYRKTDSRLAPSLLSDTLLWLAFISISLVAGYSVYQMVAENLSRA